MRRGEVDEGAGEVEEGETVEVEDSETGEVEEGKSWEG